jgi:hypothetical protein
MGKRSSESISCREHPTPQQTAWETPFPAQIQRPVTSTGITAFAQRFGVRSIEYVAGIGHNRDRLRGVSTRAVYDDDFGGSSYSSPTWFGASVIPLVWGFRDSICIDDQCVPRTPYPQGIPTP